ncbi:unnamed protein product [Adineta steineri]|uniref:Uncharacterized protein n=1 Tax=Adineta steineri TaxID=433720 RepID=A0A814MW44_9BILA|nr:unnamed protein product [Adineta steineri]CAF1084722.1 unnamed protein product [Adineta steineri]
MLFLYIILLAFVSLITGTIAAKKSNMTIPNNRIFLLKTSHTRLIIGIILHIFMVASDIYPSDEIEDDQKRRWNIIATRVYILIIILSLIGSALFLSLITQTTMIKIKNPTKEKIQSLPSNARCPCSQISFPYGKFISLQKKFHQVCSSELVLDRWLKTINTGPNSTLFLGTDFRAFGSAQFQALAGFCRLSKVNIEQSINSFYLRTLLSAQVLSEIDLKSQMKSLIDELQSTAPNIFNGLLRLVNDMIRTNELITALQTNAVHVYYVTGPNDIIVTKGTLAHSQEDGSRCMCKQKGCKKFLSAIHSVTNRFTGSKDNIVLWIIPGISSGCMPVTSILLSTLECFYNQTCLDKLISYFATNETFEAMNVTEQSRFYSNSTVQSIVDKLMIEDWIRTISYENYYSQCAPSLCTYYEVSRHNKIYILTKLISLLAGFVIGFKLVILIVIRLIRWLKEPAIRPRDSICIRCRKLLVSTRKKLIELNLFKHYPSTDRQIRHQRYATRIYILLLCISLVILTIYTLLQRTIQSKTIPYPTQSEYLQLRKLYPNTLSCPCTSISMPYSTFIKLQPYYHQLCSSNFTSQEWISYTAIMGRQSVYFSDYRGTATIQFQTLSMFCEEAHQTINDTLRIFFQTKFVSIQVISEQSFEFQMNSLIENWKSTTINTFKRTIRSVREITQGNQLSNGGFNSIADVNPITRRTIIQPRQYSTCNCGLSRSCLYPTGIYNGDEPNNLINFYSVPNFFLGCYPIEALFSSTLDCFYDLSCMLTIHNLSVTVASQSFTYTPLDKNLNQPNETIELIVNRLMVDKWFSNVSFSSYYDKCSPSLCTFEYEDHQHFGYFITIIITLYGGLSLGLQFIIWIGLQFIEQIMSNCSSILVVWHSVRRIFSFNNKHKIICQLQFVLVVIMLTVFFSLTTFNLRTKTVEIRNITLTTYKNLLEQSHESFQCPCSQISIKYREFLDIEARYHQICSSDFVSNPWITYIFNLTIPGNQYNSTDFYHTSSGQFQLLASLCRLSEETANQSLLQLIENDFINIELLSPNLLENRIQSTVNEFELTMPNLFINTISLIREMIAANMLMSVFSTNWMIGTPQNITHRQSAFIVPLDYQDCTCAVSSKCVSPSRGMLSGCYPLETILQSTLECLFIPTCINITGNFKVLNISLVNSSRFPLNTTVETIVNKLMVEEFLKKISYASYFDRCAPLLCSYSYDDKNNLIEGITTLIGLYGGLTIICRLLSKFIVRYILCRRQRINPITN